MTNVITFPEDREPLMAVLYSAVAPGRYVLVIVDPEKEDPIHPSSSLNRQRVREAIVELSDMADSRGIRFEVRDFSEESTIPIADNDNG